jgi:hypothetical protein
VRNKHQSGSNAPRPWLRRHWRALLAVLAAAGALGWYSARGGEEPPPVASAATAPAPGGRPFFAPVGQGPGLAMAGDRAQRRKLLLENYQLADHTLCSYREGTQYPPTSRPMSQNPDQVHPNQPVQEANSMHLQGGGSDEKVQLQTSQSRVHLAPGESAAFSLRAVDSAGNALPLVVTRAVAQGITFGKARPGPQVPLDFMDDGSGKYAAVLAPGQTALANFNGTIRTEVRYNVGGRNGFVFFDVIYSPELPASWAGQVRETVENGSLVFYLKVDVREPGRYIVSGRIDDARGTPFALATFNDMLGQGPNEVRLVVFGKLMRDQDAALPLTLRDVDGYLLKENADPDRALMPRLEGRVATSKAHSLKSFSDAEWQSEERGRYLAEFGKDVRAAAAAVRNFDPALPLPPSECGQAGPMR